MSEIMSSGYGKKLKIIRVAEGLTQARFASDTGIGLSTIKNYETGITDAGLAALEKVVRHNRFYKYTMWLMTNTIAPEFGQIAPIPAHYEEEEKVVSHSPSKKS